MSLLRNHFSSTFARRFLSIAALVALFVSMQGSWSITPADAKPATQTSSSSSSTRTAPAPAPEIAEEEDDDRPSRRSKRELSGKLNLNTATEEQLQLLPTVGPAKAERIVAWRKKNGGFKRPADLRKVKGFGYKTLKRLEPYLEVSGETTLTEK